MAYTPLRPDSLAALPRPGRSIRRGVAAACLAIVLSLAATGELSRSGDAHFAAMAFRGAASQDGPASPPEVESQAAADPSPWLTGDEERAWALALLGWAPQRLPSAPASVDAAAAPGLEASAPLSGFAPPGEPVLLAQTVPLPVPRPPEFQGAPSSERLRLANRRAARRAAMVEPQAQPEDTRNFFERLFGGGETPAPVLAYAALENSAANAASRRQIVPPSIPSIVSPSVPTPGSDVGTAIYDISARIVKMPNGDRLEAHSGLGESMDDPRAVHLRMRGPTPPGIYDLTEREAVFHGVRALRLNPVGGHETIYGRVGLLTHSYLLGPLGASNGCVSFKDYDKFLQAYLRGEVRRLVVVAGAGRDAGFLVAGR